MLQKLYLKINFEKTISITVLLFAFFLPLSRAAVSFFIILIPFLWIIEGNYKVKIKKIQESKALISFLVFIVFLILSLLWTEHIHESTRELRLLFYYFTLLALATSFNPKYFQKVITSFLVGLFISELIAYGVYFKLWQFKHATPELPSPFMNHLDYSVFLAFGSVLLLNRLFSKEYNLPSKIGFFIFFLSITGNLLISGGRTGQVALIMGIIVMSVMQYKFSFKAIFISFLLIMTIFFSAYKFNNNFHTRIEQAQSDIKSVVLDKNYTTSWGIRAAFWITTYNILEKNPLLGVGIGDYKQATKDELSKDKYIKNFAKDFMSTNTPHNQYLLILLQIGFLGFLIFLYFIYQFFKLPIEERNIKETSILFGTIFFVSFMADTFLMDQFTLALFCLFCGIFIGSSNLEYKKEEY